MRTGDGGLDSGVPEGCLEKCKQANSSLQADLKNHDGRAVAVSDGDATGWCAAVRLSFSGRRHLWLPADLDGESLSRTSHNYSAVARLGDGVTVEQANREISAIARRIHDTSNAQGEYLLTDGLVVPPQASVTGRARAPLLVLLGAVGFLLLVACANVTNLMLAQLSARERELAVRSALGAGRGRLIRQLLTESLLLSLVGGGLGVLGSLWGVAGLIGLAPDNLPRLDNVAVSVPVLVFAFVLSTAVAAALGAFTAAHATSRELREELVEGGRGQAGGSRRIGRVIVAVQMASRSCSSSVQDSSGAV